jgi:ABC-type branched-subunit amino acid transport system substrate-binding protein
MEKWRGWLVVAAIAVALSGCGTSSSRSGGGGDVASGDNGSPVNIGVIAATGTAAANAPGMEPAARAAIDAVNKSGGLAGHPINIVYCNDKADPNTTAQCARQMVSQHVEAVVGGFLLNDTVPGPILAAGQIPWMGAFPFDASVYSEKNAFFFNGGSLLGQAIVTTLAGAQPGAKLADVYLDVPASTALLNIYKGLLAKEHKSYATSVPVPVTTADYAPVVQQARANGTNAIQVSLGMSTQGPPFIKAAESVGAPFKHYFAANVQSDAAAAIGPAQQKLVVIQACPPFTSTFPLIKQFVSEIKASGASLASQDCSTFSAWLAVHVIAQLTKGAKSPMSSARLMQKLNTVKNVNLGVIDPSWTPNAPGPLEPFNRVSNLSEWLVGFRNGKPHLLLNHTVSLQDVLAGKYANVNLNR